MKLGFLPILTLIFITLKLTGTLAWPWLWVLSPLWIPAAITLCFFAVAGILIALNEGPFKK